LVNIEAIFSDETPYFRYPYAPEKGETVHVIIRTWKDDVDKVELILSNKSIKMSNKSQDFYFDYFGADIFIDSRLIKYYFKIYKRDKVLYYFKTGAKDTFDGQKEFVITTDFNLPTWSYGAIMYQIYVDKFYNGDKNNDVLTSEYTYLEKAVEKVHNWEELPKEGDYRRFYGGDLQGVIEKLEYLKKLGAEVIYLNPIFVSPSSHKYDTQDYDHVDPHFGKIVFEEGDVLDLVAEDNENATLYISRTTDDRNLSASDEKFIELVEKAHGMGIKIILDGVFNHCGAFNKWLDKEQIYSGQKGALENADSPWHDYFVWDENGEYKGWWGHLNHPKLNYEGSKELEDEMIRIGKKWVSPPFNADG